MSAKRCTVCSAKVLGRRWPHTTCDPICNRAKKNGFTREEQITKDIANEELEFQRENRMYGSSHPRKNGEFIL